MEKVGAGINIPDRSAVSCSMRKIFSYNLDFKSFKKPVVLGSAFFDN
jgi:hypothetical protein